MPVHCGSSTLIVLSFKVRRGCDVCGGLASWIFGVQTCKHCAPPLYPPYIVRAQIHQPSQKVATEPRYHSTYTQWLETPYTTALTNLFLFL